MADESIAADRYHHYADRFSTTLRQIAIGGLGIVWLFKAEVGGKTVFPHALLRGALLIGLALVIDLIEQFASTFVWSRRHFYKNEMKSPGEAGFFHTAIWLKFGLMMIGYFLILYYVGRHWFVINN